MTTTKTSCDCSNPDCSLPAGRCFLCELPVDDHHAYPICDDCLPVVQDIRSRDPTYMVCEDVNCRGWAVFNGADLQSCDMCDTFSDDSEAAEHVLQLYRRLQAGEYLGPSRQDFEPQHEARQLGANIVERCDALANQLDELGLHQRAEILRAITRM